MKLRHNGKAPKEPMIKDLEVKYSTLFELIEMLITDKKDVKSIKYCIKHLEWIKLFYELIRSEHKKELSPEEIRMEYRRFYSKVVKYKGVIKPYKNKNPNYDPNNGDYSFLGLCMPYKKADTFKWLEETLEDCKNKEKILEHIKDIFPYEKKKKSPIEQRAEEKTPEEKIRYKKWKIIEAVKDKDFYFIGVEEMGIYYCEYQKGQNYKGIKEITIIDVHNNIKLKKDIDFKVDSFGGIEFFKKYENIKVTITTEETQFKKANNSLYSLNIYQVTKEKTKK